MEPQEDCCSTGHTQRELPPALKLHILSFLPPNDRALSGRLACRDAADGLSCPQHSTASLSQPLPFQAFEMAQASLEQHARQLPFRQKLQLLSIAATSGSGLNLEVVWWLLERTVVQCLSPLGHRPQRDMADCGVAAVSAGQPQVLAWLLCHCPAWLRLQDTLRAAARHCDLAGLQTAWQLLPIWRDRETHAHPVLDQEVLDAAAESSTADTIAKMEWLLSAGGRRCRLEESTAVAAARCANLRTLQWLHHQRCAMHEWVLWTALQHADLAVVQWLVDEAGCKVPAAGSGGEWAWKLLIHAAVRGRDAVAKLQWLKAQGVPLSTDASSVCDLVLLAAEAGQAEVLRHLLSVYGPGAVPEDQEGRMADGVITSGCIATAECLRDMGVAFSLWAYGWAGRAGSVAMVRWLACSAGVSAERLDLSGWIGTWPSDGAGKQRSQDLLEAVQLLLGCAGCRMRGDGTELCAAARRGDVALVQYLHHQQQEQQQQQQQEEQQQEEEQQAWYGHQPERSLLTAAAEGGCEALLEWLVREQGCCVEGGVLPPLPACVAAAKRNGDQATLDALHRLGMRSDDCRY